MLNNVKAMIVVLSIASMVFLFAKPICLQFMEQKTSSGDGTSGSS